MKRAICFLVLSLLVRLAMAEEWFSPLPYPISTQKKGQVFVAKALFPVETDGLWFQDQNNKLFFFDGQTVLPNSEFNIPIQPSQLAFLDHAFWLSSGHEVYRVLPGKPDQLVFSLSSGSEIRNIGTSGRYVWVADQSGFYTYQVDSKAFSSYSLDKLEQYSQFSDLSVSDAELTDVGWVLATNHGLYISDSQSASFKRFVNLDTKNITDLHYSLVGQKLVVGTDIGAYIIDLQHPDLPSYQVSSRQVLSLAGAPKGVWIGTISGLEFISFSGTSKDSLSQIEYFVGQEIYSVIHSKRGEIWVSSDSGIYFFSEFSRFFSRLSSSLLNDGLIKEKFIRFKRASQENRFWLVTSLGLRKFFVDNPNSSQLVFEGQVNDAVELNETLWLATDEGVLSLDISSGSLLRDELPSFMQTISADLLVIDRNEGIWGADEKRIWRYDTVNGELLQFASEWMTNGELDTQLNDMDIDKEGKLVLGTDHGVYVVNNGQVHYINESYKHGAIVSIDGIEPGYFAVAGRYGAFILDVNKLQIKALSLVNPNLVLKCLTSTRGAVWLSSTGGLTRYSSSGQLRQHYGEPFGLIDNELQTGLCNSDFLLGHESILLGSKNDLIIVDIKKLNVSSLPKTRIILSEVRINQSRYSLGSVLEFPHAEFGDSLSFQFGALPSVSDLKLEYRLSKNDNWISISGFSITLAHSLPGHYVLEVRGVVNGEVVTDTEKFIFSVDVPWYMGGYAALCYLLIFIAFVVGLINWRSRLAVKTNRILKSQIALKTNQLRHQSRILLTNNEHLRKQLQVRRILYQQLIEDLKVRLKDFSAKITADNKKSKQQLYRYINHELDLLLNYRAMSSGTLPAYSLALIVKSVLDGWQEEIINVGLSIETDLEHSEDTYVTLYIANLDRVFNLLVDNLIRRCAKGQRVYMTYRHEKETVTFSMSENVQGMDDVLLHSCQTWSEIEALVKESGGTFRRYTSNGLQLTEFTWPKSSQSDEDSITQLIDPSFTDLNPSDQWLKKLQDLVITNYSDSEFGTAAAAKQMYTSERSLQRRFKSATERTFTDYLTEIRLDYACRRLLNGQKVSDVAFECGFNDPSYFSRRFRHRFGVSPTQFVAAQD
ncbi:helix-turn-helix domain-containing protein [Vibrio sp. OCN044]|uniref:Helix-turn-helix domain-containing protein n=1 Tax=Vibrio tetraodonis subsp. pristinus TaxID=2695891 RepID=A0A6L8LUM9_9VIBR|nr:AraC family transcriptional regulator [Vibrio tetraodonis]MYM59807.1 helix-turn-helix domain-containing protein [Vibrio tetraodonis subsp. pristinus]